MFHFSKEPIKQKLLLLAGVFLLMLVTIVSTEFYLRRLISTYQAAESNQMAHRRLGRVIIRELITIERDVSRLATASDIRDVPVLHRSIAASLDSIGMTLGVLQHGGTFADVLPANINDKDEITEAFSYQRTEHAGYTIAVIDLTPKIMDIKETSAEFVRAARSRLAENDPDLHDRQNARTQLLHKRLRTDLQRARENATKVFYASNQEIERLEQLKIKAVSYVDLSHGVISVATIMIGVFVFSRVFRQIGDILTNRRQAEEHVRTLKRQMEFILDATKTGLDIIAPDYTVKFISPGWEKVYGDPTGRKCYEYFMGHQEPCLECGAEAAFATKNVVVTEETLVKENNRPTQVTTIPYQDDEGHWFAAQVKVDISERKKLDAELERYRTSLEEKVKERTHELTTINASLNTEIGERIKAEAEARESREVLQRIIDSMPVGVMIVGKDKVIRRANQEALRLTERDSPDELLEQQCFKTLCPAQAGHCPILDQGQQVDKSEKVLITASGKQIPILKSVVPVVIGQEEMLLETFTDIGQLKAAEAELKRTTEELIEASHQAGKAEVAINVLHNVGNVLNSVNVSTTCIHDIVAQSEVSRLSRITCMIEDHLDNLGDFLTQDSKGQLIPEYLINVAQVLCQEQKALVEKTDGLNQNINHIKEIIVTQQACARSSGLEVHTTIENAIEDALRINQDSLDRHGIQVQRQYAQLGQVRLNKQKVVQILVNLIANAKDALEDAPEAERTLTVRFDVSEEEEVRIEVIDNGAGIAPEHLIQIFRHGFTTKKHGHGFGLHGSALAAKEMKGSLTVTSEGIGQGACFMLDIPFLPVGTEQGTTS